MILFYAVPPGGDPTNLDDRTEWGRTIDGAIIEDHGEAAAPESEFFPYDSFTEYVTVGSSPRKC